MKKNKSLFLIGEIVRMDLGNGKIQIAKKDSSNWELWDNIDIQDRIVKATIKKERREIIRNICSITDELSEKNHDLPIGVFADTLIKKFKKL